jgi:hypothetical protein
MATTTRVPFVSATTSFPNQCHKFCLVAKSITLPVSSSSLKLSSSSYSSSSLLSFATQKNLKGVKRVGNRISVVVAMAEPSKFTVLVTGAAGRTGLIFLLFALMGFHQILCFLVLERVWTRKLHFSCSCFVI